MVFLRRAEGKAGALVAADHTPDYFGTSTRGCGLGKENDAFCLLSQKIKRPEQDNQYPNVSRRLSPPFSPPVHF